MITQNSKIATKYTVFWYNEHYLRVIVKTYFLIRFLRYMKYGPKNLVISFTSKNLTHFGGLYHKLQIAKGMISNGMKKMLFWLVIIIPLLIGCVGKERAVSIPAGMEVTRLSDILKNPVDYDNKKVLLEGIVGPGCLACPSDFPYQEGVDSIKIFVKGFKRPDLRPAQPIRVYAEVKVGEERVVISALALEVR
jgi:hypothetical protein